MSFFAEHGRNGSRTERLGHELGVALYARFHPLLCQSMPHRFFPVAKSPPICIRCGVSLVREPRAVRVRWWRA